MKPWSLSKVQCYENCPMKYKFQYIDKIKPEKTKALSKGSKIHNILENIDNFIDTQEVDSEHDIVNAFIKSKVFESIKECVQFGEKETAFGIDIVDNQLVPTEYNNKVLFRGKIDLLYKNNIIDYKTGKSKTYSEQDWTQLKWYAVWFFLKYPEYSDVNISYVYVEHNHINTLTINRGELSSIINDMISRIRNVTIGELKPITKCNKSALCGWCSYMLLCEELENKKPITDELMIDFNLL